MFLRLPSLSVSWRIVLSVAVGLATIQLLYAFVALWTIQESTSSAYADRVALARALAKQVDSVLGATLDHLQMHATSLALALDSDVTLSDAQRGELTELRLEIGPHTIVSISDYNGHSWTEPPSPELKIDPPANQPCFKMVRSTGTPAMASYSPAGAQTQLACLAVPLRGRSGEISGVLVADINADQARQSLLAFQQLDGGTSAEIIDIFGHRVAGKSLPPKVESEHLALLNELVASHASGYRIHNPAPSSRFPEHIVAYAPITSVASWGVIVEQPRDMVVALPTRLEWRLALFGLAALLFAIGVAWYNARRIVRPLRTLTIAAERFAAGNLNDPLVPTRADELGTLSRSFELMRQRLRASLSELEQWNRVLEERVASRTAENRQLYENLRARERELDVLLRRLMDAQEDERRRVAQELHDETSQALASLQLGLERLASIVGDAEQARELAMHLRGVASGTLAEVHRLAVELRPSVLDDLGLVAAIERFLDGFPSEQGLAIDFVPVGIENLRLRPEAETAVYRIVQAALTNIVRHARATSVSLLLEKRDRKLVVVVEDDGRGFDLAAIRAAPLEARLGLAGMEERAALIGAQLTIETAAGCGCTLFLEVSLDLKGMEDNHVEVARPTG